MTNYKTLAHTLIFIKYVEFLKILNKEHRMSHFDGSSRMEITSIAWVGSKGQPRGMEGLTLRLEISEEMLQKKKQKKGNSERNRHQNQVA